MPIINLQRRMAEQGRIRLGHKVTGTAQGGRTYTRPAKLEAFRFTSPSARLIDEVAGKYGGEPRPWDNAGKAQHEVITDATTIPVIVVKGGFSQWHELWSAAGCIHRCDGEKDVTGEFCDPQDPQHLEAIEKPTTRLSVMLSEIETLGVWRMESKGWNAAAELPTMAELAMVVGDYVPASLSLVPRTAVVEVKGRPQTSHFVVPVLDLHVSKHRLVALVGGHDGAPAALEQVGGVPAGRPALEGAPAPQQEQQAPAPVDYRERIEACADLDALRTLWHAIGQAGHLTPETKTHLELRLRELTPHEEPPAQDPSEPVDAEVVGEEPPAPGGWPTVTKEQVWNDLIAAGGRLGMSMAEVQAEVVANTDKSVAIATVEDLQGVLELLTTGVVPEGRQA